MAKVAPDGPVYQAGTLSGNPLATAAGIAMLNALREPGVYERLEATSARIEAGLRNALDETGVTGHVTRVGSMLCLFFAEPPVRNYDDAKRSDTKRYAAFFHGLLRRGVYFPPSQFETFFVSLAHNDANVEATLRAAREALSEGS
jgi:glutamate-1-semialdehyde 2,1-aminomutase